MAKPTTAPGDDPPRKPERVREQKASDALHPDLKAAGCPEPTHPDGSPNSEYYRWLIKQVTEMLALAAIGKAELPKNFNPQQTISLFEKFAEINGLENRHLIDTRTDAEKAIDAVDQLLHQGRSILELMDAEVEAIETAMDQVDGMMHEECDRKREAAHENAKRMLLEGAPDLKQWRSLLRRVVRLRDRARKDKPAYTDQTMVLPVECARTLRFMLYVGRSNMAVSRKAGPAASVFAIGYHHVVMCLGVWEAVNGVVWYPDGPHKNAIKYEGCMLVCAPGHGKTEFGAHFFAERYCQNPHRQVLFGHSQEDQASKNLTYVRACFNPEEPQGRRCRALYPHMRLAKKGNNGASAMYLSVGGKVKQASGAAYGIKAAISGSDASDIWFDDPVDQKEAEQVSERERTFHRMNATWLSRLRGKETFHLTTTTLWHPDDANMRRIDLARRGEVGLKVVIQACGGPNSKTPFQALWPEMYPSSFLRAKYKSWRNPALYSAAYMADPRTEATRIIRSLKMFDPESVEHQEWARRARYYISVDPAATNREGNDHAGLVLAGIGPLRVVDHDRKQVKLLTVLRIIEAAEIHANQIELADKVASFVKQTQRKIDGVLIETKSGFHAIADYLDARCGIRAERLDPGMLSKEKRLRSISTLIDNSSAESGFDAVVEFPGVVVDGELVPDPNRAWMYDQILKFGIVPDDHALDAITQLVNFLQWELSPGEGWKSSRMPDRMRLGGPMGLEDEGGTLIKSGIAQDDDMAFFGAGTWN